MHESSTKVTFKLQLAGTVVIIGL